MLTVLGGLAEFERHLILARTTEGRKRERKPEGFGSVANLSSRYISDERP